MHRVKGIDFLMPARLPRRRARNFCPENFKFARFWGGGGGGRGGEGGGSSNGCHNWPIVTPITPGDPLFSRWSTC